jgi:mannosyltransferase OCH1-like enzyme
MKEMRITRARMEHVLVDRSDGWVKLYRDIDLIEQDRKRRKVQRRDVFKTKRDETRQGKCGGGSWTHGDRSITDRVKSRETKGDSKKKIGRICNNEFCLPSSSKSRIKEEEKDG